MTATTFQTSVPYQARTPEIFTRVTTYVSRFTAGTKDGREIAARYFELSRLSHSELASRGLNRPCDLCELMSQRYGDALGR
jgi:hypothetical protein